MEQLPLSGGAAWVARLPDSDDAERQRGALLEALAASRFEALDERVALILKDFPETRDNDTELVLRFWHRFDSHTLETWKPSRSLDVLHDLERVDSITRSRRRIQNKLHLFEPTEWTKAQRQERQRDFLQYLSYRRDNDPELRFYLDETGSHGSEFVGVGGLCILDWGAFEPHFRSIQKWRAAQGWSQPLHFADLREQDVGKYTSLLQQVLARKAVVLFVAHALPERSVKNESLFLLFVHLVLDALDRARRLGCLRQPRAVTVFKEQDVGFDRVKLDRLEELLSQEIVHQFPDQAYLRRVESVPKGADALMECADLVASAVRRRMVSDAALPKDLVSATVMKETGLESFGPSSGAVFRVHGLGSREE